MAAGLLAGCTEPQRPTAALGQRRVVHHRPAPGGTAPGCGPAPSLTDADKITLFQQFSDFEEAGGEAQVPPPPGTACGPPAK